jgi:hypothetical protein
LITQRPLRGCLGKFFDDFSTKLLRTNGMSVAKAYGGLLTQGEKRMKVANSTQYLNLVKDLKIADDKPDKLPDSIGETPDLSQPKKPETKVESSAAKSEAAKLSNAAQESLARVQIENQIGKNLDLNRLQNLKASERDRSRNQVQPT